jgi:hypothetical protein
MVATGRARKTPAAGARMVRGSGRGAVRKTKALADKAGATVKMAAQIIVMRTTTIGRPATGPMTKDLL